MANSGVINGVENRPTSALRLKMGTTTAIFDSSAGGLLNGNSLLDISELPGSQTCNFWLSTMNRIFLLLAVVISASVLSFALLIDRGSSLGASATTEGGFFLSGTTRLSYALDIPVVGSPPYPMVVFGHDSGPNTKNEDKDWARHLVKNGVAVFRFDKRGVGDSDGVYRRGFVDPELISGDLVAAVEFVAQDVRVDRSRIGLMGSSQAGWIVPMAASRSEYVAFTMILYGPAVTNRQHDYWDVNADDESLTISELSALLADFQPPDGDFDPRPFIEEMTAPGLWLFGDQDRIIPTRESAQIVRDVAEEFGRPFTVVVYPDVKHGLRPVFDSSFLCRVSFGTLDCDRIDFWVDLLPWLDSVIK